MYTLITYAYDGKPNVEEGVFIQNINILVGTSDGKMQQWYPTTAKIPMDQPMADLNAVQAEIQTQALQFVTDTFNA